MNALSSIRYNFAKVKHAFSPPNLIQLQQWSFREDFLQLSAPASERKMHGLQDVLSSIFPIEDANGTATVEFVSYSFDSPKYDVDECRQRNISFAAPLKLLLRLIVWDVDEDTGSREVRGIKEQDVYIGDIPFMTENGTFIINGIEKVIISQLHRSPGVVFEHDRGKTHTSGKLLYSARIIPYRGSWLDFEFDAKDILFFRIDRKRKLYVSTFLLALGFSKDQIFDTFYNSYEVTKKQDGWLVPFTFERYKGSKLNHSLVNADTGEVLLEAGKKITARLARKFIDNGLKNISVSADDLIGNFLANSIVDPETGEELMPIGHELAKADIETIVKIGLDKLTVLYIDNITVGPYIRNTVVIDRNNTQEEALFDIFRVLRPGEPANIEAAEAMMENLFFNRERYDLSNVGRVKINERLDLNIDEENRTLTKDDIIRIIKALISIKDGYGEVDDIDHLGNRRVRSVGELVENQFRIGMVRMERSIMERMNTVDIDTVMPHDLVNSKMLATAVREFFGTSQLAQFMDQTNPLSEVTHKRRLSALGPGGLTRDRATFEVRDVHPTHYGRICPIETPEGQNIGLINSMATFAKVNRYGFIESPYRKVIEGRVTDEVVYISANGEGRYKIAQADAKIDANGNLTEELVQCHQLGEFILVPPSEVDFIDVSPMQLVSVAASLIPFLENDDANRALMGSNMQRQAVPLLRSEAPLVGTGMEALVARDSGSCILAKRSGYVEQADAKRIVIKTVSDSHDSPGVDIYNLLKYQRSNYNTCINQVPQVNVGQFVNKGDIIADGPSCDRGELALGRNVLVAFMPWNGYNFEDSILISERLVKEDMFTSVHIEEFEIIARDTRIGPEEITRDIPNVSDDNLRHLDEVGIVHIGAEVKAGDILVGKVTPKSESPTTPEEKLLRAIFGEKAADVRDTSRRVPSGVSGTVVEVRVFSRRGIEKDERSLAIEYHEIERLENDRNDELTIIETSLIESLLPLLDQQKVVSGPKQIAAGTVLNLDILKTLSNNALWQIVVEDTTVMNKVESLREQLTTNRDRLNKWFNSRVEKLQSGDDLPQGALKVVKVFVAMKHKLQPGDKMAGRHGNKGVISRIMPAEDMPFLADGTPVDMVLNPLGVPSRMNVGQILETHLGWASANIGKQIKDALNTYYYEGKNATQLQEKISTIYDGQELQQQLKGITEPELVKVAKQLTKGVPFATPVFDGAKEVNISEKLADCGIDSSGQMDLYDGRTGDVFERKVTIGYIYMLKLHHLVDDKIHARSIGPYSLVTQQPLGGKSHFGGQRFGEMECWALQAYGAAYTLQEMLTVKSDDVTGRVKIYESIIRGDQNFDSGIPESFHVMIKELKALCLNVELIKEELA